MAEIPENIEELNPDPAITGDNSTENDTLGKIEAPNTASITEKIRDMAAGAYNRVTEKISRGRGRPRNCPKCGFPETKCACAHGAAPAMGVPAGGTVGGPAISQEVVTLAISAVIKSASSVANSAIIKKTVRKTGDIKFANQLAVDCSPTKEELESLGTLADICLRKYGVGSEYMPEIGLGAILLGIGARYVTALKTISDLPEPIIQQKAT